MKHAQGRPRSMPDGFLHIQNFTVTKASGIAGAVWAYLLTQNQREIVELLLVERAKSREKHKDLAEGSLVHWHHATYRFRKDFLKDHFAVAVHEATKVMHVPVVEVFKSKLFAEREALV